MSRIPQGGVGSVDQNLPSSHLKMTILLLAKKGRKLTNFRPLAVLNYGVRLERNIVIEVAATAAAAATTAAGATAAITAAAIAIAGIRFAGGHAAALTATAEHGELAAIFLQHDFGRVFLGTALIGPFAGLQLAFDVDCGALFQIALGDIDDAVVEDHDAVPLGLFLALARGLVAPAF